MTGIFARQLTELVTDKLLLTGTSGKLRKVVEFPTAKFSCGKELGETVPKWLMGSFTREWIAHSRDGFEKKDASEHSRYVQSAREYIGMRLSNSLLRNDCILGKDSVFEYTANDWLEVATSVSCDCGQTAVDFRDAHFKLEGTSLRQHNGGTEPCVQWHSCFSYQLNAAFPQYSVFSECPIADGCDNSTRQRTADCLLFEQPSAMRCLKLWRRQCTWPLQVAVTMQLLSPDKNQRDTVAIVTQNQLWLSRDRRSAVDLSARGSVLHSAFDSIGIDSAADKSLTALSVGQLIDFLKAKAGSLQLDDPMSVVSAAIRNLGHSEYTYATRANDSEHFTVICSTLPHCIHRHCDWFNAQPSPDGTRLHYICSKDTSPIVFWDKSAWRILNVTLFNE